MTVVHETEYWLRESLAPGVKTPRQGPAHVPAVSVSASASTGWPSSSTLSLWCQNGCHSTEAPAFSDSFHLRERVLFPLPEAPEPAGLAWHVNTSEKQHGLRECH